MGNPFLGKMSEEPPTTPLPYEGDLRNYVAQMNDRDRKVFKDRIQAILDESSTGSVKAVMAETLSEDVQQVGLGHKALGMVASAALDGLKLVGAQQGLLMGREALLQLAEWTADHGLARLPLIGRRIKSRRIARFMSSDAYLIIEFLGIAGAGALLEQIPNLPKGVRKAVTEVKTSLMTVQASQLALQVGSPLVKKALQAFEMLPKLISAGDKSVEPKAE